MIASIGVKEKKNGYAFGADRCGRLSQQHPCVGDFTHNPVVCQNENAVSRSRGLSGGTLGESPRFWTGVEMLGGPSWRLYNSVASPMNAHGLLDGSFGGGGKVKCI
jgi:hypothetical protein